MRYRASRKSPLKRSNTLQNAKDAELKEPCKAYAKPYLERGKYDE
jgi:hypothetical protein